MSGTQYSEAALPVRSGPVVWVSQAFGYNGDLLYYGEIFQAFRELEPDTAVVVERGQDIRNPHALRLVPLLRMYKKKLRRMVDGQLYETFTRIPLPDLIVSLRRLKPRALIMIEFTPVALLSLLSALAMPRTARIHLVESDPTARGGSRNPVMLGLKRWMVRRMDVIQTNTEAGRRYLEQTLGADPARIRVAPYLSSHPPGPAPSAPDASGPVRLLFANSLTERKGMIHAIAALALCPDEVRRQIDLTIVGDGPERPRLEAAVADAGLEGQVHFAGRKTYDELGAYFAGADVLLVPSLVDYRSLAGFEGLSYSLALIASRFDGASLETVEEGVNGHAIDPADHDTLARILSDLVNDRERLAAYRRASGEIFARAYSIPRIAANLRDSVALAVARRGNGGNDAKT